MSHDDLLALIEQRDQNAVGEVLTLADLLNESFGLGLLVADLLVIQWALRQNDLDAGSSAHAR